MNFFKCLIILSVFLFTPVAKGDLKIRVIDTGAGLATAVILPDKSYLIYDAGHWNEINTVMDALDDFLPTNAIIDTLILSHTDSDHIAATPRILRDYAVNKVIRTGLKRSSGTWKRVDRVINDKEVASSMVDMNLAETTLHPGTSFIYGDAIVTFLAGSERPPLDWDLDNTSEKNNAGSIVMRIAYKGKSVLFMGDAVGRHNDAHENQLIATEKFLVDNSQALVIDSDVLIASHHGADNGSAKKFIEAVSPEWVIFSAGHDHEHPRKDTAERIMRAGVQKANILRTDLGDDEDDDKEWQEGKIPGHHDRAGDDGVLIEISSQGQLTVTQDN